MEIEIKLNVRPAIAGGPIMLFTRLAMMPEMAGLSLGPVRKFELRDLYYDTPEGGLARAGAGLRLRQVNGRSFVTLKISKFREGALTEREEFEEPLTPERFEWVLSHLTHLLGESPVPIEEFRAGKPAGRLVPVLEVGTARLMRQIGAVAQLAMDMVEYPGLAANPFFDIEAEAIGGEAGANFLRRIEEELYVLAGGDLVPAGETKLERGLRLKQSAQGATTR